VLKRPQAARLLAVDREAPGTRLLMLTRGEASIGSAEGSKLHVADPNVAVRHAIIRYSRGRYYLADLKFGTGTFVNGNRIRRTQRRKHGDVLRFGGAPPYRFIDPDAQKRRRRRRILRVGALVAILIAIVSADRFEKWGLVSVATLSKIVALVKPNPAPKHSEPPNIVAVRAPAPAAPPSLAATIPPSPVAHASSIAVAAAPVAASTAIAAPAPIAAASASPMTWLERINFYRGSNGLHPIRDNSRLSAAVTAHAHYLMLNFADNIRGAQPIPADAYEEKPGTSGYSVEGAGVAQNLQIAWGCSTYDAAQQIDRWLEGPFHRLPMLDPYLGDVGYGEAAEDGCWVAALRLPPPPEDVKPYRRAVEFPPEGADIALEWIGLEVPDALASCSGYERPVGLPITLQMGRLVQTRLTNDSLTEDGKPIEFCAFDAPGYRNPNPTEQEYGRWSLRNAGAIVLVPRAPLRPGSRYQVSITTNDVTYAWSFTAAQTSETTFSASASFPTQAPVATPAPKPVRPAAHRSALPRRAMPAPATSPAVSKIPAFIAAPSLPAAEATPETSTTGAGANWLTIVNLYRTLLKLQPVEEDPALSQGCRDHAKYLVMNYGPMLAAGVNIGALMHTEDESKPGYTPDGIKAARASDVMFQGPQKFTAEQRMTRAIEFWIAGPFHRPSLVNPDLRQVGFGEYCDEKVCASSLDWRSDLESSLPGGHPYATPIQIPPDGATVKPSGFGGEWPSPISNCPGYPNNAPAITIQVGINMPATLTDASLIQTSGAAAGTRVGTCPYDFQTYANPDPGTQAHGREVLRFFGEAVMMVRDPLSAGQTYRVDMTVNGKPYMWSITAAP
jgi:uncharacterized protein YkwD